MTETTPEPIPDFPGSAPLDDYSAVIPNGPASC